MNIFGNDKVLGQPGIVAVRTRFPASTRVTTTDVPLLGFGILPTLGADVDHVMVEPAGAPVKV